MKWIYVVYGVIVVVVLVYFVAGIIGDRLRGHRLTSRPMDDTSGVGAGSERQVSSRIDDVEKYYGKALPSDVKWLFNRPELLNRKNFAVITDTGERLTIDHVVAPDVRSIEAIWYPLGERSLPIAVDQFDNYLYVSVDADGDATPVRYLDHDGGGEWLVAESLRRLFSTSVDS